MSARADLPEGVRFVGVEPAGGSLRFAFEVTDQGTTFVAYVSLDDGGAVTDMQSSDGWAGTTGRPAVDELVCRRAQAELVRARAAQVVADFDRRARRGFAA